MSTQTLLEKKQKIEEAKNQKAEVNDIIIDIDKYIDLLNKKWNTYEVV